ncbi:MAG: 23S rRNA (adenine(2503)-C(2))-methyltransferase RlmN [Clostridia bacterium]|nr:23S rRNA (adenine(2503)-C(2))-methyltransferase RlmN [Clostridia bacterium]
MKALLSDMNIEALRAVAEAYGEKPYRAKQLFEGICQGKDWDELTTFSKSLRARMAETYDVQGVRIVEKLVAKDGTTKYLFGLRDGNIVEGVVMQYRYGNTICISTQVGCRMNCAFCASGIDGLVRNLSAGEMLGEVVVANRDFGGDLTKRAITNVVLMGSGEPMDNYDNVAAFLRLLSDENGLNISLRNVSLSTCGVVPGVDRLIEDKLWVTLTFSLHAPFDETRSSIMPVNKAYCIGEVMAAARRYFEASGRRVVFEYTLIKGTNDSKECARALAKLVRGFPTHVNLIVLNYVKEKGLKGTGREEAKAFLQELEKEGVSATIRRTMGADIDGACGQLRRKHVGS